MEKKAKLLYAEPSIQVSRQTTPEFYRLYQQSVLMALEEQGVLNRRQLEDCLERLGREWADLRAGTP